MASGCRGQPNSASSSSQLKSSTSSVTSVGSIKYSFSTFANVSTKVKPSGTKNVIDSRTENALIKEIYEQFLNCRLCLKPFLRPKTLNCLHTFCEECLLKYKDAELEGNRYISYSMRSKMSCPLCAKKTDLPPGGVRRLPDSFLLSNLNQVVSRVSRSNKSSSTGLSSDQSEGAETLTEEGSEFNRFSTKLWCGICSKSNAGDQMTSSTPGTIPELAENQCTSLRPLVKNQKSIDTGDGQEIVLDLSKAEVMMFTDDCKSRKEATVECLDCSAKLLCRDCAMMHMNTEVTQNHSLVDIALARQGRLQCTDHVQEVVRFYCESCERCVCILCTFNDHKTHRIVTFSESIKIQTQTLEGRFEKCKQTLDTMKEHLNIITNFETRVAFLESLIKEKSIEMIRMVKEEEGKSLGELRSIVQNDEVTSFLEQKPYFEQMLTDMENTLTSTDHLLKTKSVEIILMKKKMENEMKNLLEWTSRNVPERMTTPLFFEPHHSMVTLGVLRTEESTLGTRRSLSSEYRSENYSDVVGSNFSNTSEKDSSSSGGVKTDTSPSPARECEHLNKQITVGIKDDSEDTSRDIKTSYSTNIYNNAINNSTTLESHTASTTKSDAFTDNEVLAYEEKSTWAIHPRPQTINKASSTDTLSTSDKGVCTVATHVASAYRDVLDSKSPKLVMVSRGTMTDFDHNKKQDRSSSPFKIIRLDKATMANKAELSEPKDVFCRPGLEGKPKKIIESIPASARLDSINEGSDEDRSSGEDTEKTASVYAKPSKVNSPKLTNRLTASKPLPSFSNPRSLGPNSAIVYPLASRRQASGDKFKNSGNKLSPSKRFLDIATNTEIINYEDKSVATETSRDQTIVGCINILKTVRNRMESIPSPGNISMENSDANMILSRISEPSSSIASSSEADKNGVFSKLTDSTDGCLSVRDVKKYILSVDAGGSSPNAPEESSVKKSKSSHSPVSFAKRQRTPGPSQSADGSNSSGKSSTNNSPGLRRSGKAARPLLETSKSPKMTRAKLKSVQDSALESRQRQMKSKNSPGLTDLSDSLHSESSEEYDRCGSGESFAGASGCSAVENDHSFVASLKQRLVGSPLSCRRQKADLPKVVAPTNKSPRPQRKF